MTERWPSPSKRVVDHAAGFLAAAEALWAKRFEDNSLVIPYVMNATFSIELYLKSCLVKDKYKEYENGYSIVSEYVKTDLVDKKYQTHVFKKLLEGISPERKDVFSNFFDKDKVLSDDLGLPDFESTLLSLEGLFMNSRYAYSNTSWANGHNIQLPLHMARLLDKSIPEMIGIK